MIRIAARSLLHFRVSLQPRSLYLNSVKSSLLSLSSFPIRYFSPISSDSDEEFPLDEIKKTINQNQTPLIRNYLDPLLYIPVKNHLLMINSFFSMKLCKNEYDV